MTLSYSSVSQDVSTISVPKAVVTSAFCPCDFECEYFEYAFGNNDSGSDEFKNDKTRILVKLTTLLDTVTFTLVDLISGFEYALNNTIYGEYFENEFSALNPLYAGLEIEWNKVLTIIGSSSYRIKISHEALGRIFEKETHKYVVLPFDDVTANKTIRFKSTHSGYLNTGFDYANLNWVNYIRLPSVIKSKNIIEEATNYTDLSERKKHTIQERTSTEWLVSTDLIPSEVYNSLIYDKLKADKLEISDYSVFAKEKLRNLEVTYKGIESVNWLSNNTKASWGINLEESQQKIKRYLR